MSFTVAEEVRWSVWLKTESGMASYDGYVEVLAPTVEEAIRVVREWDKESPIIKVLNRGHIQVLFDANVTELSGRPRGGK